MVGEAVRAIQYRVGIFFPMQHVVEIYSYAEFPEGVVEAGIEQGEGLILAGGDFFPGDVCGEGQFQGGYREEGEFCPVQLRAEALPLPQVARECPCKECIVIQFQKRPRTGVQMDGAFYVLSVVMNRLALLQGGILTPRVGGLQGDFGLEGTEVFAGFSRRREAVGMVGNEVLCLGDLFGGNLLAVYKVIPSAAIRCIQIEEPHLQRNLEVIVQVCCQYLCV